MEQSSLGNNNSYIGYSLDQIRESCRGYEKLCETFFNLASDDETKRLLMEILYEGRVGDYYIGTTIHIRDNPAIEGKRRIGMANILITNPETFYYLVANNIDLFHGTNANALPSILNGGLKSLKKSLEDGSEVITGEEWSRNSNPRSFISVTDVLDVSRYYSELSHKGGTDYMSFPIIFCMKTEELKKVPMYNAIGSELPEIGIKDLIPLDKIAAVCVPPDKVKIVERMIGNLGIKVLALVDYEERIYYMDDYGYIEIIDENLEKQEQKMRSKPKKKFSLNELKNLALKRKFSEVLKYLISDEIQLGDIGHGR